MPRSAPMALPTMRAVGVARPSAQGQAMTRTATVEMMARVTVPRFGFTQGRNAPAATRLRIRPGKASHASRVRSAIPSTTGTKTAVTRSAKAWMGTLEPWASSTRRTT